MAKTFMKTLPVRLTQAELLERGEALALQRRESNWLDDERRRVASEFKEKIDDSDAESDRLAEIVREKAEPRPVECRNVRDVQRGVVEVMRIDTAEIVESRVMTELERQTRMFEPDEDQVEPSLEASR
jgi:hypothetical protein